MPAPMINFPFSAIVDGILSYIQWVFGNPEITPAEYRWNSDDRKSLIRISGPFVVDNEKPMSAPFIVVERGPFTFQNIALDNAKSADPNTFENPVYTDFANGYINVICGAGASGEASSIANFLSIMLQSDRKGVGSTLKFVRNLYYLDVSPEVPVFKDVEIKRWEVTVRLFASLQMGWIKSLMEPVEWTKAAFYETSPDHKTVSNAGIINEGQDVLVDTTMNFGTTTSHNPQLLEQDLARGYYYIRLSENAVGQLYTIKEIVDNHTLKLETHNADNEPTPWLAPESQVDVGYQLLWNHLHVYMEIPGT